MDVALILGAILSIAFAFASVFSPVFAYVAAVILFGLLLNIWLSIPLKLNWSRNMYDLVFKNFVGYLALVIFVYGVAHYQIGFLATDGSTPSFWHALYFSITTLTTLQYGEFKPTPEGRFLASAEALTGVVLFVPLFASFLWLYCQDRLWPTSVDALSRKEGLRITQDPVTGAFIEIESDDTKAEAEERRKRFKLNTCTACGATEPRIEKYWDIIGRTVPLARFSAACACGERTPSYLTAYQAWRRWNRTHQQR